MIISHELFQKDNREKNVKVISSLQLRLEKHMQQQQQQTTVYNIREIFFFWYDVFTQPKDKLKKTNQEKKTDLHTYHSFSKFSLADHLLLRQSKEE